MGTGTSRAGLAIAALTLGLAACGGSGTDSFAWLHPQAPPSGWRVVTIPSGAAMAYPPTWRPLRGDAATATVALRTSGGRIVGYLNLTPRQGAESLSNWASFRTEHNGEEGNRGVKRLASATNLRFRSGRGSCVKDSYTTITGADFIEIACLVIGGRAQTVIVAAAPPDGWAREAATLKRAIEALRT